MSAWGHETLKAQIRQIARAIPLGQLLLHAAAIGSMQKFLAAWPRDAFEKEDDQARQGEEAHAERCDEHLCRQYVALCRGRRSTLQGLVPKWAWRAFLVPCCCEGGRVAANARVELARDAAGFASAFLVVRCGDTAIPAGNAVHGAVASRDLPGASLAMVVPRIAVAATWALLAAALPHLRREASSGTRLATSAPKPGSEAPWPALLTSHQSLVDVRPVLDTVAPWLALRAAGATTVDDQVRGSLIVLSEDTVAKATKRLHHTRDY